MPAKAKQQASAIDGGKRRSSQAKGAPPGKKLRTEFTEEDLVTVLGFTDKMGEPKNKQKVKDLQNTYLHRKIVVINIINKNTMKKIKGHHGYVGDLQTGS